MSALVLRRELSLEVPKLLVGAVQPYQTLAGPALTTSFLHQPELLPFQAVPFAHAAVAPLYFHTLLHSLAEFAETPRTVQHSHVKQQHAPLERFWDAVGTLNCFYYSAHVPAPLPQGSKADEARDGGSRSGAMRHPAMGAVELVRPLHRRESDVKLTLFDADHQPIASMRMTGPKSTRMQSTTGAEGDRAAPDTLARTPLPSQRPPLDPAAYASPASSTAGDVRGSAVSSVLLGGAEIHGGLYGEVEPVERGYAQRAYYWVDSASLPRATTASGTAGVTMNGVEESATEPASSTSTAPVLMPPWVLYDCVQRFFFTLHSRGCFGADPAITAVAGWRLCSHHVVQLEDAALGEPVEVVCAAPRVYPRYRLPPWRHELGLPLLHGGDVPCVCLRCEVRQGRRVISTGVYFFCRWP